MKKTESMTEKNERLKDYLPVSVFIVLTFLLEALGFSKATNLVISVFISLFIFGILAAMLREKYGEQKQFKPLQKKIGILTFIFILIVAVAFLHWYQVLHVNIRWALFFIILIIYFFTLFRSVNALHTIKTEFIKRNK